MTVLSDENRAIIRSEWMRDDTGEWGAVTKPDLRAAVNAADDWVNGNAASFNGALPALAQSELTASQKAQLLVHVVHKRFIVGEV